MPRNPGLRGDHRILSMYCMVTKVYVCPGINGIVPYAWKKRKGNRVQNTN